MIGDSAALVKGRSAEVGWRIGITSALRPLSNESHE